MDEFNLDDLPPLACGGCTIYHRRPAVCREFDCRGAYWAVCARTTRAERRRGGPHIGDPQVLTEGRRRLRLASRRDGQR